MCFTSAPTTTCTNSTIAGFGWTKISPPGPTLVLNGSSLTSFVDSAGEHVLYIGTDNHVHQLYYSGTWVDQDLSSWANGPLVLFARKSSLWRRSRRPRLRDPEPVEELHRDIDASTHRFVVRALSTMALHSPPSWRSRATRFKVGVTRRST
jgi:hypothetical protein